MLICSIRAIRYQSKLWLGSNFDLLCDLSEELRFFLCGLIIASLRINRRGNTEDFAERAEKLK